MSRPAYGPMVPLSLAAAATTWITLWCWQGFVVSAGSYLVPSILGLLMVTGVGMLGRWGRWPVAVLAGAQVLTVVVFVNLLWGSSLLPTFESLGDTARHLTGAVDDAQRYAAPVPGGDPRISALLVLGGVACHVLVDLTAVTLRRVPVAGLPLLTIYSLPLSILLEAVSWPTFVLSAAGFLLMLVVQEEDRISRWGRPPDVEAGFSTLGIRAGRHHPLAVGASATTLAVLVPLAMPTLELDILDGPGTGSGSGDRTVRISNPMTDMRRNLVQGADFPVLRATTDQVRPSYLRVSVLATYNGSAWTPGGRDLPADNAADGTIPEPTGLDADVPRTPIKWQIDTTEQFESLWLPAPLYVQSIEAGEAWRYDAETLDFHAAQDDVDSEGISYGLTSLDVIHDAERMIDAASPPSGLEAKYTRLPDDVPPIVDELARQVTAGETSDFERADALQDWFRDSGEFVYSTEPDAGNGTDDLVRFLADEPGGRVGYCEQFASAMAVMARSLGIPSRVAVGFLNSERVEGRWEFSSRDLHAWPELYFEGSGWVRFEPTPADRETIAPSYTDEQSPTDQPTSAPTGNTAAPAPTAPTRRPDETPEASGSDADGANDSGVPWTAILLVGGLLVLAGLVLLGSRMVHRSRTLRRWNGVLDPAEAAWAELRTAATDLGVAWPEGRSPRAAARLLAKEFAAPPDDDEQVPRPARGPDANPEAVRALGRIVRGLEAVRFSAEGASDATPEEMRADAARCVDALRAGVSPRARRRSSWLPRSVLSRERVPVAPDARVRVRSQDDVVDHVG